MSAIRIYEHPFKEGVRGILRQHFHDSIAKNFVLFFETEIYNDSNANIRNQKRDQNFIMEVHYRHPSGLLDYITDVASWWPKKQLEVALLKGITDKARVGVIGRDWTADDAGKISLDVQSGKYETPDSEITKDMSKPKKGGK